MNRLILPLMMFGRHRGRDYIPGESKGLYPSVNTIYVNTGRGGGRRLSTIAEKKQEEWHWLAVKWARENNWKMTENKKVVARMWFYLNDKRRKDTSNAKKLICDALEGVIYDDDYFLLDRTMDFKIDRENPRIEIEFERAI